MRPIRGANGDVPCVSTSTPHTATAPRAKSPGRLLNERCALSSSPATRARIAFPADASLSRGEVSPGRAPSPEARIVRVCRTSGRVGQESAAARPRVRGSMGRYVLLVLRTFEGKKKCSRKNAHERVFSRQKRGFFTKNMKKRLRRSREKMVERARDDFFRVHSEPWAFGARAPFTRARLPDLRVYDYPAPTGSTLSTSTSRASPSSSRPPSPPRRLPRVTPRRRRRRRR